jgi:hypothetical protein
LWNKKAPAVAGAFLFVFRRFLRGYWENACFLGGVFVVKMWWIRGGSWSDMPSQMEGENLHGSKIYFSPSLASS